MIRSSIAPLAPRFEEVRRIAVLRGGGIGDLVGALPAIEALAAAYPDASVTLLGVPSGRALLEGRANSPVTDVEVVPPAPGVRGGESDPAAVAAFLERLHGRFDLAVQAHGGGRNSNPFLLALGARYTIGTRTPDAPALTRDVPYRYYQHEVHRWLEVAALAGAAPVSLEPRLEASPAERAGARRVLGDGPVVVLHPGATDPRRRWPADRFGAVAAAVARRGARVAVVGDASDVPIADAVVAAADQEGVVSLADRLSLGELVGVLAEADLVVANDSGPRHLAAALGTPTVGIFWFGNALNAAPFGRSRHRVLLSWTTHCPVCGMDVTQVGWKAERCSHDPSFVAEVDVDDVLAEVDDLLAR